MRNLCYQTACLLSILTLSVGSVVASTRPSLYFTAGVGGAETAAKWDLNTTATFVAPINHGLGELTTASIPYQNNSNQDIEHAIGQVGVGIGMRFMEKIFLGVEGSIAANTSTPVIEDSALINDHYQQSGSNTSIDVQLGTDTTVSVLNPDINVDIKLGIHFSPYTIFYLKGGAVFNELELEANTLYSYSNPNTSGGTPHHFTTDFTATEKNNVTGVHAVLGIEHLVTRNLSVNLEYSYVHYGDISLEATAPTMSSFDDPGDRGVTIDNGLVVDTSAIVTKQTVMLGLILYFGSQY